MASLTDKSFDDIEMEFKDSGYGDFKKAVADAVCDTLSEIQNKYQEIIDSNIIDEVLKDGAIKAQKVASETLNIVQEKIGIVI